MINEELRNKQKQEAIERLKILQKDYLVHKNVLKEFKENEINILFRKFWWIYARNFILVRNNHQYVERVKEIEEKRNIYVYKCILSHTNFGDILDCLYISSDEENWGYEREQLENDGIVDSYCINLSDEYCSEFSCIEITGVNGGLARIN